MTTWELLGMDLSKKRALRGVAPIVVVDPDPAHQRDVTTALHAGRLVNTVVRVDNCADLALWLDAGPAAVLTATTLPDGSFLDVLADVRRRSDLHRTPVVVLGQDDDCAVIASVREHGATAYLAWPVAAAGLVAVLRGQDLPWVLAPVS